MMDPLSETTNDDNGITTTSATVLYGIMNTTAMLTPNQTSDPDLFDDIFYQQHTSMEYDLIAEFGPKRDPLQVVIPLTIIYGLIFVTGVIGNISTCIVIKKNRSMHTATNYYLFSLAISDFLLLISGVPQEIYLTWSKYPYVFGEYFCVGRGILAETSANATVLTITAFTVERYVAICHPFLSQAISKLSRAIRIIVLIWILSILTAIPQALQFGIISIGGIEKCVVVRIILQHSFQLSTYIFFFAPMSIIFVLYLLIGLHLYRSNVIGGGALGNNGSMEGEGNFRNKDTMMKRFRRDLSHDLSDPSTTPRGRGRFGMKSVQSDTILYRYSGGAQVSAVRGRMNQFGTKRVLKMLVAVVICFFLCWAPFHAQRLIAVYGPGVIADGGGSSAHGSDIKGDINDADVELLNGISTIGDADDVRDSLRSSSNTNNNSNNNKDHHEVIYTVMTYISGVLYYLSTCINPLLYNLMSNKFRQAFKSILFGKKSTTQRRSQNSHRSIGRKTTLTSSSGPRDSIESELQSKVSLMQTVMNDRKMNNDGMIP
ncbi:pyrokinin-1 receptor isoform X2 [Musca domestica]|nr:pyrokinin-1 receptor isoform X2 [Musca domestica]XP_019890439.1 pyrokinin-1 receptor isoform X2 [Musca domestica]XP_058978915.1 pyrokinin-1 receptor isoform X2 [Musca domestica]XP_058978920.1 pyrokinin-1 receptor isoform X2 [Musca domestica]